MSTEHDYLTKSIANNLLHPPPPPHPLPCAHSLQSPSSLLHSRKLDLLARNEEHWAHVMRALVGDRQESPPLISQSCFSLMHTERLVRRMVQWACTTLSSSSTAISPFSLRFCISSLHVAPLSIS